MKYLVRKDIRCRKLFAAGEIRNRLLKYKRIHFSNKEEITNKLGKRAFAINRTKIKSRCIWSKRARSIYSFFRLSRITMRELIGIGFIPGIRKSSW